MTVGYANPDLGRWHTGAACSLDCEGTLLVPGCGVLADGLTLSQARSKARTHAKLFSHHVTIEYPKFQTVYPPYPPEGKS